MSTIKKNIVANYIGSAWTGVMNIVFVPVYIHFLGIEAYGLIGIFTSLYAIFGLLDMGLGATLTRELARMSVSSENVKEMRDLVRTLEIPYWIVGLLIGLIIIAISPLIAHHWVNSVELAPDAVESAIIIMGLVTVFQWPIGFYSGGLIGLQRQVELNIINSVITSFRGCGAIFILYFISPTIKAFFYWQVFISISHVVVLVLMLRHCLPYSMEKPIFNIKMLQKNWKFAAEMTTISILSTVLTQLDKVILSKMLLLDAFGYYVLANSMVQVLYRFVSPIFTAMYPMFTAKVATESFNELIMQYHKSAQLMSVILVPIVLMLVFFSKEILFLWTQNSLTTENTYSIVSILAIGTCIHGFMHVPYALQLAFGWTKLSIIMNTVSVVLLVPLLFVFAKFYFAVGAAIVWVLLNLGYIFIGIPAMHVKLIPSEKWRWYWYDICVPALSSLVIIIPGRFFIEYQTSDNIVNFFKLFLILSLSFLASIMSASNIRSWFINRILMASG